MQEIIIRLSSEAMIQSVFFGKGEFQKGSKSHEKLPQVVQLRAYQTLCKSVIRKRDEKILAVTRRDIVAAEARYHISCYTNYTRELHKNTWEQSKR